jgi:hypothetical protein
LPGPLPEGWSLPMFFLKSLIPIAEEMREKNAQLLSRTSE